MTRALVTSLLFHGALALALASLAVRRLPAAQTALQIQVLDVPPPPKTVEAPKPPPRPVPLKVARGPRPPPIRTPLPVEHAPPIGV